MDKNGKALVYVDGQWTTMYNPDGTEMTAWDLMTKECAGCNQRLTLDYYAQNDYLCSICRSNMAAIV